MFQFWILLVGICLRNSLAVVNQKNDNSVIPVETPSSIDAYGVPLSSKSSNSSPSDHQHFIDDDEARNSNFEATTPVFPLTAPSYDYSPLGLNPPEEDVFTKQSGYLYSSSLTTTLPPTIPKLSGNQLGNSYLPPVETDYDSSVFSKQSNLPSAPSPFLSEPAQRLPPKPTYIPPISPPKPAYSLPRNPTSEPLKFQYYPSGPQYPAIQSSYTLPKPNYIVPSIQYTQSREYLPPKTPTTSYLIPSKQDYIFLSSPQDYTRPSSKFSFYKNLRSGVHSLLGRQSQYSSSVIQTPPTPPLITYDGWRPMKIAELKDINFDSYTLGTFPQSTALGQNILESETEHQQFPKLSSYFTNQIPIPKNELTFDFIKSFSNLALSSYDKEFDIGKLSEATIKSSPHKEHAQYCEEHSSNQFNANICCITSPIDLNELKGNYQNLNQQMEQLGLTYGVPSGKQIEGPKLHPKIPVKFRPPVPSGLLESIGKNGQDGSQSTEFMGQTYIPPAIPEVSNSSSSTIDSNSYDAASLSLKENFNFFQKPLDFTRSTNNDYASALQLVEHNNANTLPNKNSDGQSLTDITLPLDSLDESFLHLTTNFNLSPELQEFMVPSQNVLLSGNQHIPSVYNNDGDYNIHVNNNPHSSTNIKNDQVFPKQLLQNVLSVIERQHQTRNVRENPTESIVADSSNISI